MSTRKPEPLISNKERKHCPVCGEVSYSAAGIHPQCAAQQADEKRVQKIKKKKKADVKSPADATKPWQKTCPKCREPQHVRKKVCDCGHTFAVRKTSAASGRQT